MFNLLGRQNASRTGSSDRWFGSPQLFSEHDVRELFETFRLDPAEGAEGASEESAESRNLIPSKSKDGLIIRQMLTERLKKKLSIGRKEMID
jgi:hypothetical protein